VFAHSSSAPDVVLEDGSNLLHAVVDRTDVVVSADHLALLLQVLRQRMRPEEFMGRLEAEQLPRDLRFIEHKNADGLTVLFKVRLGRHNPCKLQYMYTAGFD
jgi:hypothetical protein